MKHVVALFTFPFFFLLQLVLTPFIIFGAIFTLDSIESVDFWKGLLIWRDIFYPEAK